MGKLYIFTFMEHTNPFLVDRNLELIRVIENQYLGRSGSFDKDGHITEHSKITTVVANRFIEKDRKVSFYKMENIKGLILNLSANACKLYMYFAFSLQEGQDYVKFVITQFVEEGGMSKNTVYKAIEELQLHSIIAKKRNGEFWINPFLFFNGNRIDYFQKQHPDSVTISATIKR